MQLNDFEDLLNQRKAITVYKKWHLLFEKRIVEYQHARYVFYRFLFAFLADLLCWLLLRGQAEQISLQRLCLQPKSRYWLNYLRHPGFWVVIHYEAGDLWNRSVINDDVIDSLGGNLARLHSIQSQTSRDVFSLKPKFDIKKQLKKEALGLLPHRKNWAEADREIFHTWLNTHLEFLDDIATFQLTHGDLTAKNILLKPDGQICFIDYDLIAFKPAGLELAQVLITLINGRLRKKRDLFVERYLSEVSLDVKSLWLSHQWQWATLAMMRLAHRKLIRAKNLARKGHQMEYEKNMQLFERYVELTLKLMSQNFSNQTCANEILAAIDA